MVTPIGRAGPAMACLLATACTLAGVVAPRSQAVAATKTFTAARDTYTSASAPRARPAKSSQLKVDGRPRRYAYLLFDVRKLGASVTSARLRIHARTSVSSRLVVRGVRGTRWSERRVSHAHRPRMTATIARRARSRRRGWVSLDVTKAVRRSGRVAFALTSTSRREMRFASREGGRRLAPRLVVRTQAGTSVSVPIPAGQDPVAGPLPVPGIVGGPQPLPLPPSPPEVLAPYDSRSAWNTRIHAGVATDPLSPRFMAAIADNAKPLTSDPDQYAIPVYLFDDQTPRRTVQLDGFFSSYDAGDDSRVGHGFAPMIGDVPIPDGAVPSDGSDGQIVFWDRASQTEYAFWQFHRDASGAYRATNGYRYRTGAGFFGRFADGLAGRGAGLPYLGGLVRRAEIDRGRIDHALAFAYDSPSPEKRYPAAKSDGVGVTGSDLPEGARLQLDPAKTEADFAAWGLAPEARTIARALQTYGMYVIDNSGSSKIYLEDRLTAGWHPGIDRDLVKAIPWSAFRVVLSPSAPG